MNLLLDTHALLWFVAGDGRLARRARQAIEAKVETMAICTGDANFRRCPVRLVR
jgi:PIN domain nuclease of toxin-antitoxin system